MFSKKAKTQTNLEQIIANLEEALKSIDEYETEKYDEMVANLEKLYKLKNGENRFSTELSEWIPVIGSLSGITVIVLFEAFGHTLTTKALSFVSKVKG